MDGPPKDKDIEIEILNNDSIKLLEDTSQLFLILKIKAGLKI